MTRRSSSEGGWQPAAGKPILICSSLLLLTKLGSCSLVLPICEISPVPMDGWARGSERVEGRASAWLCTGKSFVVSSSFSS